MTGFAAGDLVAVVWRGAGAARLVTYGRVSCEAVTAWGGPMFAVDAIGQAAGFLAAPEVLMPFPELADRAIANLHFNMGTA